MSFCQQRPVNSFQKKQSPHGNRLPRNQRNIKEKRQKETCVVGFCHFIAISPKVLGFFPSFTILNFVAILFHYISVPNFLIISNPDMVCLALKKKKEYEIAAGQKKRERKD